MSINNLYLKPA